MYKISLLVALLGVTIAEAAPLRYKIINLGAPAVEAGSYPRSQASALNAQGMAVGTGNFRNSSVALSGEAKLGFAPLPALTSFVYSVAKGINSPGVIVGSVERERGEKSRGFYLGADLAFVDPLAGDEFSSLSFVNDAGEALGVSGEAGVIHAIYTNPALGLKAQALANPEGSAKCRARAISGDLIYGDCESERREDFPVAWKLGEPAVALGLPENSFGAKIHGANGRGLAVGSAVVNGLAVPAQWAPGEGPRLLAVAEGDNYGEALGVNDAGTVVGYSSDQTRDTFRAVVFARGKAVDLRSLVKGKHDFASLDRALDVNAAGVIAGYGTLKTGGIRGFLLLPLR